MDTHDTEAIARSVFAEIAKRFPSLNMVENHDDPVEVSITMPVQPGLAHKVWLCLQNGDELSFSTNHFYVEWFPCTKSDRVENYLDAVTGFLSGKYRVLSITGEPDAIRPNYKSRKATAGARLPTGAQFGFPCLLERR